VQARKSVVSCCPELDCVSCGSYLCLLRDACVGHVRDRTHAPVEPAAARLIPTSCPLRNTLAPSSQNLPLPSCLIFNTPAPTTYLLSAPPARTCVPIPTPALRALRVLPFCRKSWRSSSLGSA